MVEVTPIEACPECSYSWQGLPETGRCPECGFSFNPELRVWKRPGWMVWTTVFGFSFVGISQGVCAGLRLYRSASAGSAMLPSRMQVAEALLTWGHLGVAFLALLGFVLLARPAALTFVLAIDQHGIYVRNVFRSHRVAWARIERIERGWYFVRIHVRGERTIVFRKPIPEFRSRDFTEAAIALWRNQRERNEAATSLDVSRESPES